jgi:Carbohydrate esterase, sialic acid-specific acetylesterase
MISRIVPVLLLLPLAGAIQGKMQQVHNLRNRIESTRPECGGTAPVQVFVLAGQSNMEGQGRIEHLQLLVENNSTNTSFADQFWDDQTGDWVVLDGVYVDFLDRSGPLTVGFGAYPELFGPELGFGWKMKHYLASCDKPILLLKMAWGGRDLAVDFRPPSSGLGTYEKDTRGNVYKTFGATFNATTYGWQYRDMIDKTMHTLEHELPSLIPGYQYPLDGPGYSLEGFVWFQGWNDVIDSQRTLEYGFNLANLIRDVRTDLNVTDLPFVVGETGQHGFDDTTCWPEVQMIRQHQENVTLMDEFKNTTRFVPTHQFVISDEQAWDGSYHYCKFQFQKLTNTIRFASLANISASPPNDRW